MKQLFSFFIFLTFCSSFQTYNPDSDKITLKAIITKRNKVDLEITIFLNNNSSDTLKYVSWDCSWQSSYTVDSKSLEINESFCYKNSLRIFEIPPYSSETKILSLKKVKGLSEIGNSKFKIGFHFRPPSNIQKTQSRKIVLQKNDLMIWSNEVESSLVKN